MQIAEVTIWPKKAFINCFEKFSTALISRGYTSSKNDYSLPYRKTGTSVVYMAIYVDDILIVGNDDAEITHIKNFLDSPFKIKDLGTPHYFMGLEFQTVPNGVVFSQQKFATNLISEFDCSYLSLVVSPLDFTIKLLPDTRKPIFRPFSLQKIDW